MQVVERDNQVTAMKELLEEFREENTTLREELDQMRRQRDQLLAKIESIKTETGSSSSKSNVKPRSRSKTVTSCFPSNASSSSSSSSTEDTFHDNECFIKFSQETTRWNHGATLEVETNETNDTENRIMNLMLNISGNNSPQSMPETFRESCKLLTDIVSGARSLADLPRQLTSRSSSSDCHFNNN